MEDNQKELTYCLALLRAPEVGAITFLKLIEVFHKVSAIFSMSSQELLDCGLKSATVNYLKNPDWLSVEKDLVWAEQSAHAILTWQDSSYPKLLHEITGMPPVLYIHGDVDVLSKPQLAIVGSRNPSPPGIECAHEFAKHLASNGFTITSGLALGIDAASHRGALAAKGLTIAVMGAGIDCIYPARHKELARQIVDNGGALISEFPPETLPRAENFPRRNRLISGLSLGVLVVEAALQSGSLITAKYALDQNREVFAIPGSIHNPLARGCHALLKQGAKLVETATDVLEELGPLLQAISLPISSHANDLPDLKLLDINQAKLVECVGFETTPIDVLVKHSGLPVEVVSSNLVLLELQGYIISVPGGYVRNKGQRVIA